VGQIDELILIILGGYEFGKTSRKWTLPFIIGELTVDHTVTFFPDETVNPIFTTSEIKLVFASFLKL